MPLHASNTETAQNKSERLQNGRFQSLCFSRRSETQTTCPAVQCPCRPDVRELNTRSFARCAMCLHAASKGVSNGTGHCVICPLVSNGAWPEMPLQLCRSGLQLSVCVPRISSRHIRTRHSLITSKLDGSATSSRKVRQPCTCSLFTLASSNFHSTALPAAASMSFDLSTL